MTTVSATSSSATWLQSQTQASNWIQSSVTSNSTGSADWMDPNGGPSTDPVLAAANAFASAEQISSKDESSLAVNKGISVLSSQVGNSVNILA